ncbi:hypothetical protein BC938DRAFT_478698 [Jimgerdemannia flammicorona]|uniref:UBZ4-type domain-containing protein n=1 Tax=Jimgerdemannia flammicorona TaxID=994334 RepID=A0A433QMG5_9FUNG|nr:hypothetical protein BC938DRAFT_478698 [Jimgerdemannia flammicorona]
MSEPHRTQTTLLAYARSTPSSPRPHQEQPRQKRRKSLSISQARKRKSNNRSPENSSLEDEELKQVLELSRKEAEQEAENERMAREFLEIGNEDSLFSSWEDTEATEANNRILVETNNRKSLPPADVSSDLPQMHWNATSMPVETPAHCAFSSPHIVIPDSEEEEEEEEASLIRKRHSRSLAGSTSSSLPLARTTDGTSSLVSTPKVKLARLPGDGMTPVSSTPSLLPGSVRSHQSCLHESNRTASPYLSHTGDMTGRREMDPTTPDILVRDSQTPLEIVSDGGATTHNGAPYGAADVVAEEEDEERIMVARMSGSARKRRGRARRVVDEEDEEDGGGGTGTKRTDTAGMSGTSRKDEIEEPSFIPSTPPVLPDTDEDEDCIEIDDLSKWLEEETTFIQASVSSRPDATRASPYISCADNQARSLVAVPPERPTVTDYKPGSTLVCDKNSSVPLLPVKPKPKPKPKLKSPFTVTAAESVPLKSSRLPSVSASPKMALVGNDGGRMGLSSSSHDTPSGRRAQKSWMKRLGHVLKGHEDAFADYEEYKVPLNEGENLKEDMPSSPESLLESLLSDFPRHRSGQAQPIPRLKRTASAQSAKPTIPCPLCLRLFPEEEIEAHASECVGVDPERHDQENKRGEQEAKPRSQQTSTFSRTRRIQHTTEQKHAQPSNLTVVARHGPPREEIDEFSDGDLGQSQGNVGIIVGGRTRVVLERRTSDAHAGRVLPSSWLSSTPRPSSLMEQCPVCSRMVPVAKLQEHVDNEIADLETNRTGGDDASGFNDRTDSKVGKGKGKAGLVPEPMPIEMGKNEQEGEGLFSVSMDNEQIFSPSIRTLSSPQVSGRRGSGPIEMVNLDDDNQAVDGFATYDSPCVDANPDKDEDDWWMDVNDTYVEDSADEEGIKSGVEQQQDVDDGYLSPLDDFINLNDYRDVPNSEYAKYFEQFGSRVSRTRAQGGASSPSGIGIAPVTPTQARRGRSRVAWASDTTTTPTRLRCRRTPAVSDVDVDGWGKRKDDVGANQKWRKDNGECVIGRQQRGEKVGLARMTAALSFFGRFAELTNFAPRFRLQAVANNYYADDDSILNLADEVGMGGGGFGGALGGLGWEGRGVAGYK